MTEPPPFSPSVVLLTVARVWEATMNEALEPLGLTTRKFGLLGHIQSTPGISFSELARRSRVTVQSAHAAIRAFEQAGLVSDSNATPGSSARLGVTASGRDLLGRARQAVNLVDDRFRAEQPALSEVLHQYMQEAWARQ